MIPKVLVLSNECFSYTTSNGRTLGNFFKNWPKDRLAQFFLSGVPEVEFCKNYFQVSDKHALNAVLRKGACGGIVFPDELKKNTVVDIFELSQILRQLQGYFTILHSKRYLYAYQSFLYLYQIIQPFDFYLTKLFLVLLQQEALSFYHIFPP